MNQPILDPTEHQYAAFLAIDWADQKHVWTLQEAGKSKKQTGTLEQKPEVIGPWMAQLRQRFGGRQIAVAVEQSRGALIHALQDYDFVVIYPLHPATVAKFREAFKSSGVKSDPLDTEQILQILTKHLEQLRPLQPDSQQTRLLGRTVQDRRKLVDLRTSLIEAQTACLKEYFPQALEVVTLGTNLACDFLKKWPTFERFQHAKESTIERFFHAHNLRSPKALEKILEVAKMGQALTTDPAIIESASLLCQAHAQMIKELNSRIQDYDERIAKLFNEHPESCLFNQLPGAGPAMAPRLLAFFGTDRSRYEAATNIHSFTGVAPVQKTSGRMKSVYMRRACPKFARQTFHEFARLSLLKCQWARNYVQFYTEKGKKYQTIIRALAFKWIRILFRCWKNRTPYNESTYMTALAKRGSIFATLHLKTS
jgi:transposase